MAPVAPLAVPFPDGSVQVRLPQIFERGCVAIETAPSQVPPQKARLVGDVGIMAVHTFPIAKRRMDMGLIRGSGHICVALEAPLEQRSVEMNTRRIRRAGLRGNGQCAFRNEECQNQGSTHTGTPPGKSLAAQPPLLVTLVAPAGRERAVADSPEQPFLVGGMGLVTAGALRARDGDSKVGREELRRFQVVARFADTRLRLGQQGVAGGLVAAVADQALPVFDGDMDEPFLHLSFHVPVARKAEGPLIINEKILMARRMAPVTCAAFAIPNGLVKPARCIRREVLGFPFCILVARQAEIAPRTGEKVGILRGVGPVAREALPVLERFVDAGFLKLGMEILVAGDTDF